MDTAELVSRWVARYEEAERNNAELVQALLAATNALADSVSHTQPYARVVDQARVILAKHGAPSPVRYKEPA